MRIENMRGKNVCQHRYETLGGAGAGIQRMVCAGCGAVTITSSEVDPITVVSPRLQGGTGDDGGTQRVGLLASIRAS